MFLMDVTRIPALSNSPTNVCTGRSGIGGYVFYNANAVVIYVHFYDTIEPIEVGTTVPDLTVGLPPTSAGHIAFSEHPIHNLDLENGRLRVAATKESDAGDTAPDTPVLFNVVL
jgi:hypothetical protein